MNDLMSGKRYDLGIENSCLELDVFNYCDIKKIKF